MHNPNESQLSDSSGPPPTEPVDGVPVSEEFAAADTNARAFIQRARSESGQEAAPTSDSKSNTVALGSKIGLYELVRKLGQGGMGTVYEARHTKL